jgi:hypothetical protein
MLKGVLLLLFLIGLVQAGNSTSDNLGVKKKRNEDIQKGLYCTISIIGFAAVVVFVGFILKKCLQRGGNTIHLKEIKIKYPSELSFEYFEKTFPTLNYQEIHDKYDGQACTICLEDFSTKRPEEVKVLGCGHVFHASCIGMHLITYKPSVRIYT